MTSKWLLLGVLVGLLLFILSGTACAEQKSALEVNRMVIEKYLDSQSDLAQARVELRAARRESIEARRSMASTRSAKPVDQVLLDNVMVETTAFNLLADRLKLTNDGRDEVRKEARLKLLQDQASK
jgi:hypothetical protein